MFQTLTFTWDASAAQDPLLECKLPRGITILAVSYCPQSHTGSPTNSNIDIVDDGVDVISAIAVATAGTPTLWKSKAVGGTNAPVFVAVDSILGVALNFSGGTSPTAVDGAVVIYYAPGAV